MQKWDMETKATNKPKVVPKVVESKAGTMDISKAPEALVQEARKYKSADEFINAQLQPDDVVMFQGKVVKLKNFS